MTHRRLIFTGFIGLLLFSCSDRTASKRTGISAPPRTLPVKSESKYSKSFIDKLSKESLLFELKDSLFISGTDTAYFPTDLPLNTRVVFEGCKRNICFSLEIQRKNFTTIVYILRRANSTIDEGEAVILTGFFLGAETDEDDKSGVSYLSTEYSSENSDCYFGVRIGKNDTNELCAKVKKHCKDQVKNIELDDCPTLYKK